VLRTLQRSLSEPMVDFQQSKLNQATVFTAKFSFLVGSPRRNFKKETRNAKPAFVFERYTNESPVPTDLGSHLLSGGVTLNVPAMINRWDKYNQAKYRDATKFDPFEGHKRDRFYNL